jgi:hypothetical protein
MKMLIVRDLIEEKEGKQECSGLDPKRRKDLGKFSMSLGGSLSTVFGTLV